MLKRKTTQPSRSKTQTEPDVNSPACGMTYNSCEKALRDLFLTHRHSWYEKDQRVYAVVVSAASDTEEGDNTTKPIQGATEIGEKTFSLCRR